MLHKKQRTPFLLLCDNAAKMATDANIHLPEPLLAQVQEAARAEGSVDELAAQTVKRELARLFWERNKQESSKRRGNRTDEEVENVVNGAIAEGRAEKRGW